MIPSEPTSEFTPSGFDDEFASPADYARLYRLRGIQVVPAFMPTEHKSWKRPLLDSWKDYQSALVDDATFGEWYGASGKYVTRSNMGVITGRASNNIFVIDLDHHKSLHAANWWDVLMVLHNNAMDLETVEQVTGGGGAQKLFRAPPEWTAPTNKTPIGVDIRGQGGFAMLAPSLHESGRHYEWCDGKSPDDIPVTMAPDWLLEAVEKLVAEYGGGTGASRQGNGQGPQGAYDAFGHQTDGRETYMRDMIWRVVLDWSEACPIKPSAAESARKAQQEYEVYERGVNPQQKHSADLTKTQMLDREGRGWSAWWTKWQAAMRKWDDEVYTEARRKDRPRDDDVSQTELPKVDPSTGKILPLILTDVEFLKDYRPPRYLVDDLVQKGYLYSLTGPTGHGKTPVSMLMACKVARGAPYHGKPVAQGSVLFLAGENSDDIRSRYIAMADHEGFEPGSIPFYFIDGVIDIAAQIARIEAEATLIPNLSLIVVDTDQAYFLGDEGNSNEQRKAFAQTLRRLLKLPGNPTVLVNCHPTKNATSDNLVPIGGSAFLNEIDGNIMCWTEDRTCTVRPHTSKWRGVAFESFAFELKTITSDKLKDINGRHIPSVIAIPITESGAERRRAVAKADEDTIMRLMDVSKDASMMELARRALFTLPDGTPAKAKVQRIMERLSKSKMVYNYRGSTYRLTRKGCKAIGIKWRSGDDDDDDDN